MIPLDRNEDYWMLDDELVTVATSFGRRELSTYPDYKELKNALAAYAGVATEQLIVTPGSDAVIEHIARAYAGDGGEVLLPVPTFYGYESILERVGAKTVPIPYEERDGHFVFPLAATLEKIASGTAKILFLSHPNNPLGCPISSENISAIVEAVRGSDMILVSDEAYFEFSSGTTFLPYLAELPNLIVIRTLSKSFALAGARVGYAIAAPDVVKKIERLLLPWPVTHMSVAAALALLDRAEKVRVRREMVIDAREKFLKMVQTFQEVTTYPSETNFILVRVPDASDTRDMLLAGGVRVALGESMTRFPESKMLLKNTLRMAVPSPVDMAVVEAILARLFTK